MRASFDLLLLEFENLSLFSKKRSCCLLKGAWVSFSLAPHELQLDIHNILCDHDSPEIASDSRLYSTKHSLW